MLATAAKDRSLSFNAQVGVLWLRQDGTETGFYLDAAEPPRRDVPPSRCYRLTKIVPHSGSDPKATEYTVCAIPEEQHADCTCRGYVRHQRCRHAAAILRLLELGKLS